MKKVFVTIAVLALTLGACKNTTQQMQEGAEQVLNSVEERTEQVLNKAEETVKETTTLIKEEIVKGSYEGILPCADCDGIQFEITLNADKTYELKQTYLGKKETLTDTFKGNYSLQDNLVKLDGLKDMSSTFKVEINQLRYLNMEGNEVTGELADKYILKKK